MRHDCADTAITRHSNYVSPTKASRRRASRYGNTTNTELSRKWSKFYEFWREAHYWKYRISNSHFFIIDFFEIIRSFSQTCSHIFVSNNSFLSVLPRSVNSPANNKHRICTENGIVAKAGSLKGMFPPIWNYRGNGQGNWKILSARNYHENGWDFSFIKGLAGTLELCCAWPASAVLGCNIDEQAREAIHGNAGIGQRAVPTIIISRPVNNYPTQKNRATAWEPEVYRYWAESEVCACLESYPYTHEA